MDSAIGRTVDRAPRRRSRRHPVAVRRPCHVQSVRRSTNLRLGSTGADAEPNRSSAWTLSSTVNRQQLAEPPRAAALPATETRLVRGS